MSEAKAKNKAAAPQGEDPQVTYQISVVAEMVSTHPQTLRMYERMGLVAPQRTRNNIRMYSESDVERVRRIQHLTQQLGVNLAGVEVVFKLLSELEKVRAESEAIIDEMQRSHMESWSQVELRNHAATGNTPSAIVRAKIPMRAGSTKRQAKG